MLVIAQGSLNFIVRAAIIIPIPNKGKIPIINTRIVINKDKGLRFLVLINNKGSIEPEAIIRDIAL